MTTLLKVSSALPKNLTYQNCEVRKSWNFDTFQLVDAITDRKSLRISHFHLQSDSEGPVSNVILEDRCGQVLSCFHPDI